MQLGKTGTIAITTALALGFAAKPSFAANIVIENTDAADAGFNDTTIVDPIGENPEKTRGAQALAAFNKAAKIWSAALDSPVTIRVDARFGKLECTADSGVLASGAPANYVKDVVGGRADTWYPVALASAIERADRAKGDPSIILVFNGNAGTTGCLESSGWYLGLDGKSGNLVDLVSAVLHELGHGLGMATPMDLGTGGLYAGLPDIFLTRVMDNRTGKHWSELSAADRATSARDFHQVVWDGTNVTPAAAALLTPGMPELALDGSLANLDPAIALAKFGPSSLTSTAVSGTLSAVADDMDPPTDACGTPAPLDGKVAFIEAGGPCSDMDKAIAVQDKGAVAAILVGSQAGFQPVAPTPKTGEDTARVTIPVISINQTDASSIRVALAGATAPMAKLWKNPDRRIGTATSGRVYLYAVDPVQPHRSITHWDESITPPLLMQPSYQTTHELDLTLPLLLDLGWTSCTRPDGGATGAANCSVPDGGTSGTSGPSEGGITGGHLDGGLSDASIGDASADVFVPNPNPPGPNRYIDGGPLLRDSGSGGIPWAKRPSGCNCRVENAASEPGNGFAALLVGLAALLRRRSAKKRASNPFSPASRT